MGLREEIEIAALAADMESSRAWIRVLIIWNLAITAVLIALMVMG